MHYNPLAPVSPGEIAASADPDDFEFIEVMNILPTTAVDLTGVRFTGGVTTSPLGNLILQPGERAVFVRHPAAFAARYGSAFPSTRILGAYSGALSNQGEQLILNAAGGAVIRDFVYDDNPPWPDAADGTGPSLVLAAPLTNPDHAIPTNWRSGSLPGGNPGTTAWLVWAASAGVSDPDDDVDGDGISALLEYATGSDPRVPGSVAISAEVAPDGFLRVSLTHAAAEDVLLQPVQSTDLAAWNGGMIPVGESPAAGGRVTTTWRAPAPVTAGSKLYLRVRASLQ